MMAAIGRRYDRQQKALNQHRPATTTSDASAVTEVHIDELARGLKAGDPKAQLFAGSLGQAGIRVGGAE